MATPLSTDPFVVVDGVLVSYEGSEKIVKIPDGVTEIGKEAFKGMTQLEEVVLADSVITIQKLAFADCKNLKEVVLSSDSKLQKIEEQAFLNCEKLKNRRELEQVKKIEIEKTAFAGVPQEDTESETTEEHTVPSAPETASGGSTTKTTTTKTNTTTTTKKVTHARGTTTMTHDYDQVQVTEADSGTAMHTLTLGGETMALSLQDGDGAEAEFTLSYGRHDAEDPDSGAVNTLILKAADPAACEWTMNGETLRKLNKSGIAYLTFENGGVTVTVPTEGFLAGWTYDALKSRGTAGRRFEYELKMGDTDAQWAVTVESQRYELDTDPLAPMYLVGLEAAESNG